MTPAIRAFLRAASDGDANVVRALLAQGTNVDSVNGAGQTALMLAAGFKRHDVVRVLIAAGADLELQDDLGLTALDWAKNDVAVVELLDGPTSQHLKAEETARPTGDEAEQVEPTPVAVPVLRPQPAIQRPNDAPSLKGLAGAILRDRKPRLEEHVPGSTVDPTPISYPPSGPNADPVAADAPSPKPVPSPIEETVALPDPIALDTPNPTPVRPPTETVRIPNPVHASDPIATAAPITVPVPIPVQQTPIALPLEDETLDQPLRDLTEDTAVPRSSTRSRSRIFDLSDPIEPVTPVSKVEVSVPEARRRSYVFVWLILLVVLAGVAFGAYRLGRDFFGRQPTNASQPPPQTAQAPPPATPSTTKVREVSGEIAGAELYLPTPQYPAEAGGRSGVVRVQVQVSSKGIVIGAKATEGDEVFRDSAQQAAKSSAFSPDKLAGKGRLIEGTITYEVAPASSVSAETATQHGVSVAAGGPLSGTELNLVQPDYPSRVTDTAPTGEFAIVVRVNRAGRVMSWRPLNGTGRLRESIISAARKSTFSPEKLPGTGEVVGTITYTFH